MAETARILERGYRAYDGERGGVAAAVRTTAKHSIQRSLGLKRTIWQKILPTLSIGLAYVPAIVFVGITAMAERFRIDADFGPTYAEYYGFVSAAILVFTAFVAPEILCTDRRSGMLGLYLASPLNRNTYLLAKTLAVLIILSIVTIGPVLLVLIGKTILGRGPDGFDGWLLTFARVVGGGFAISAVHTSLSLAISSLTSRRAVASAAIVIVLFASAAAAARRTCRRSTSSTSRSSSSTTSTASAGPPPSTSRCPPPWSSPRTPGGRSCSGASSGGATASSR